MDFGPIEKRLGVVFKDKKLLQQALTHKSYINDNRNWPVGHNERLEYLGDAVLELIVSDFLYRRYPNKPEGDLTLYRSALVNVESNVASATKLGINDFIRISRGESKDVGRARQIITSDAFEAILGALYLDQGIEPVRQLVHRLVLSNANETISRSIVRDAKSRLQEAAQDKLKQTPIYQLLSQSGPDHNRIFVIGVYFGSEFVAEGKGPSKSEAEQNAAGAALEVRGWGVASTAA